MEPVTLSASGVFWGPDQQRIPRGEKAIEPDHHGRTPLSRAACSLNYVALRTMLSDQLTDVDAKFDQDDDYTPLQKFVWHAMKESEQPSEDFEEIFELFKERGADINRISRVVPAVVHSVSIERFANAHMFRAECGREVRGNLLHIAAVSIRPQFMFFLERHGVDPSAKGAMGYLRIGMRAMKPGDLYKYAVEREQKRQDWYTGSYAESGQMKEQMCHIL